MNEGAIGGWALKADSDEFSEDPEGGTASDLPAAGPHLRSSVTSGD